MDKVGDKVIFGIMLNKIVTREVVSSVIYNINVSQLEDSKLERSGTSAGSILFYRL